MILISSIFYLLLIGLLLSSPVSAAGLTFGLVAKSIDDGNFIDTWKGCAAEAAQSGDECILIGAHGAAHARHQLDSIWQAVNRRQFDALAISVTHSAFIAQGLGKINIPLITFDSPFEPADDALSQAYVGVDNVQLGRTLGELAKLLVPAGRELCIMSASQDTNLAQRVQGLRQALSGNMHFPARQRLQGEGGWVENPRCPWDTGDNRGRALQQLTLSMHQTRPTVFIAVGWWPLIDPVAFRKTIQPFKDQLSQRQSILLFAVGKQRPEYQALLDDQLIHGVVSIDFVETGRLIARRMRELINAEKVKPLTDVPFTTYLVE
ncbi:MAG: substrate-binding domain-containing protein [Gammaproteobacteria bacterium]|nr:substrate-binding domain-containing protein [Gammaproteobacteria bacterium]MBL6998968.1 substrate-binding domain-containing protein [Gammaproteobacteria bacterium]